MARILITDDAAFMRMQLKNIFESLGHEVVGEAENGQVAIDLYDQLKPDLVTLDITMPVLDGLGSLEKIMELDNSAKVIMVTAAGQKSKMVEAIKLGASEFIQKPFEPEQILSVIKTVI